MVIISLLDMNEENALIENPIITKTATIEIEQIKVMCMEIKNSLK